MTDTPISHANLVRIAGRWLKNTQRCGIVLLERGYLGAREMPDAIGWKPNGMISVVVEVKVSRSDFLRDIKKPSRRAGATLGSQRWYLVPKNLVAPEEVPSGWGLLYYNGVQVRKIKKVESAKRSYRVMQREMRMLYAHARRTTEQLAYHNVEMDGVLWEM